MKTRRMSRSTENRNAHKAIAFRGGAPGADSKLSEGQQIVTGRRLRRAARSRSSRLQAFVLQDDGTLGRPTVEVDLDPFTRAVTRLRVI